MSQDMSKETAAKNTSRSAFTLTKKDNGVAILTMDVPGESMNTLKQEFGDEISAMLDDIDADRSIKGVILASGKPASFVAGADISMLAKCETVEDAKALATGGQEVFDRIENMRRITEVAKLMVDAGIVVITAFISPFTNERQIARNNFQDDEFIEIYISTPLEIAEKRDKKGLYKRARCGELRNFTGIDSPYEVPVKAEYTIDTSNQTSQKLALELAKNLKF